MEQRPGGGLRMTAVMQEPVDYSSYYLKAKAERDRKQRERDDSDRRFFAGLRAEQERNMPRIKREEERAWRAIYWMPRKGPISNDVWERIRCRSSKPAMWPELTYSARIRVEQEAEAPVNEGILGLGLLGTIRDLFFEEKKKREAARILNRPALF
jgi:hypothetical protein